MSLSIEDIINIADVHYGVDHLVKSYFQAPAENHGDLLAKFIAEELAEELEEVFCEDVTDFINLDKAFRALALASSRLTKVMIGLQEVQPLVAAEQGDK